MTKTELIYGILIVILGAPGFWQYGLGPLIDKHRKKITPQDAALIGLLYEKMYEEWRYYINRFKDTGKGISKARYDYIQEHIFGPYKALGGNSDAEEKLHDLHDLIDRA